MRPELRAEAIELLTELRNVGTLVAQHLVTAQRLLATGETVIRRLEEVGAQLDAEGVDAA